MPEAWNPHEYQVHAMEVLCRQASAGLFLDPGLGKTSIVLGAFSMLKSLDMVNKMLIIAPLRPCYSTWPAEMSKWEDFNDLTYTILHGPDKADNVKLDVDVYIINPEGLVWLLTNFPGFLTQIDILCVDESSKFKATNTKRFKAMRPHIPRFARRWCLTGTPMPNGIMDIFGQVYILDEGQSLGRYITHFRNKYFMQSGFGGYTYELQPGAFVQIVSKIAPLTLQMDANDYLEMPELVNVHRMIDLPPKARAMYTLMERDFIIALRSHSVVAGNAAVAGGKCRQIANGAVYYESEDTGERQVQHMHDEKLDELERLLEELGGAPTLVLYEYKHDAARIKKKYPDMPDLTGMSPARSQILIDRFNNGDIPAMLGHPASMGHGLNLQGACHHVIWFGITWNFEHYDQALRRVYRQGQSEERVFIYHIMARDTMDVVVYKRLIEKDDDQRSLRKALEILQDGYTNTEGVD